MIVLAALAEKALVHPSHARKNWLARSASVRKYMQAPRDFPDGVC